MSEERYDATDKFGWPEYECVNYHDQDGNRISEYQWVLMIGLEVPDNPLERGAGTDHPGPDVGGARSPETP